VTPAVLTPPDGAASEANPAGLREDSIVALSSKPAEQPAQEAAQEPAEAAVEPEPEPVAVVLTPPDPERPKRAGWWSKAKSVLSGS
jgi:ribonuclease E